MSIYSRKRKIAYISDNDSSSNESIRQIINTDKSDDDCESINQNDNSDDDCSNTGERKVPNVHTLSIDDIMKNKKRNRLNVKEKFPVIYRCKICYSKLKTPEGLLKHVQNHKVISCQHCSYKCQLNEVMTKHLVKHGIFNRMYKCRQCEKTFKRMTSRKNHECSVHYLKGFKCKSCSEDFSSNSKLRTHIGKSHPHLFKYFCSVCKAGFPYKSQFDVHSKCRHKTTKAGKYLFQHRNTTKNRMLFRGSDYFIKTCSVCKVSVSSITELKSHLLLEHEEFLGIKTFSSLTKCQYCDKNYAESGKYISFPHICSHFDMWLYKCDCCDYKCIDMNSLRNHKIHLANSININKHKCTLCRQSFCFKHTLRGHIIFCGKSEEEIKEIKLNRINNLNDPSRRRKPSMVAKAHIATDAQSMKSAGRSNKKCKTIKKFIVEARCNICDEVFHKFSLLKYHLDRHRFNEYGNNSTLQSLINNIMQITETQSFPDISTQSETKRLEYGTGVLECEICGEFLQNLFLYSEHSTLHEKEYKGKYFTKQIQLH